MPITTDIADSIPITGDVTAASLTAIDGILEQVIAAHERCERLGGHASLEPLRETISAIKSEREAIADAIYGNVPEPAP